MNNLHSEEQIEYDIHIDKKCTGSVTLHLTICFSLLLTLICYTIESCHISALTSHADSISYFSIDSLFSNYCLPLWERYGLFALNEQGLNIEQLATTYADNNCNSSTHSLLGYGSFLNLEHNGVDVIDTYYLTDDDANDFVSQVCEHVKYLELTNLAEMLLDNSSSDTPKVFAQTEEGIADISFDNIDPSLLMKYIPDNVENNSNTDEDLSNIDSESFASTISSSIGHIIEHSLLSCIVEDPSTVSSLSVDKTTLPSVTCQLSLDGVNASYGYYEDTSKATLDKACFCEYITYTFGNYLDNTESDKEYALKYQTEYIIAGTADDDTNLINTALQLVALRTGFNLIHLLTDSNKLNAAKNISQTASSAPFLSYLIQATILTVWATAESIIDVRDLLSGKSVPLLKEKEQWNLSLEGLKNFSKDTASVNDGTSGLSYERYLEMLLIFQNNISVYYRTLDLIQMDICKEYSDDFRISKCITGIDVEFSYSLPYLVMTGSTIYNNKYTFKYN